MATANDQGWGFGHFIDEDSRGRGNIDHIPNLSFVFNVFLNFSLANRACSESKIEGIFEIPQNSSRSIEKN